MSTPLEGARLLGTKLIHVKLLLRQLLLQIKKQATLLTYLVVDDFGKHSRDWRETDVEATDLQTIITCMLEGRYSKAAQS